MPNGRKLHVLPTGYHLLAAKQEQYQKAYLLTKNTNESFRKKKKVTRTGQYAETKKKEDKTERTMREGRETREETVKWNQMTALRFQVEDIRHPQPPFGRRKRRGSRSGRGLRRRRENEVEQKKKKEKKKEKKKVNKTVFKEED